MNIVLHTIVYFMKTGVMIDLWYGMAIYHIGPQCCTSAAFGEQSIGLLNKFIGKGTRSTKYVVLCCIVVSCCTASISVGSCTSTEKAVSLTLINPSNQDIFTFWQSIQVYKPYSHGVRKMSTNHSNPSVYLS